LEIFAGLSGLLRNIRQIAVCAQAKISHDQQYLAEFCSKSAKNRTP
jgi:hypothetical protein